MAQLGRALVLGSRGCVFKSRHPDMNNQEVSDRCHIVPPPDGHGRGGPEGEPNWYWCLRKKGHKGQHFSGGYGKWSTKKGK